MLTCMDETSSPDTEPGPPFTERTHADLALDEALRNLSVYAYRLTVATYPPVERLANALNLRKLTERAIALAAVSARKNDFTWKAVGAAVKLSDSAAHDRWSRAEAEWNQKYRDMLRDKVLGTGDPDATVPRRATALDRWDAAHPDYDAGINTPNPASLKLERMSLDDEQGHLAELRAILLAEHRPAPVPPALLLQIERRQAQIYATLAEQATGAAAAEARHQADMSAAYVRDLESQIRTTATTSAVDAPIPGAGPDLLR